MTKVTLLLAVICVVVVVLVECAPRGGGGGGKGANSGQKTNGGRQSRMGRRGRNRNQRTTTTTISPPEKGPTFTDSMTSNVLPGVLTGAGMAGAGKGIEAAVDAFTGSDEHSDEQQNVPVQTNEPKITIQYAKDDRSLTFEATGLVVFAVVISIVLSVVVGYCVYNRKKSALERADAFDMRSRYGRSY